MMDRHRKGIGYFAICTGSPNIICDGDACVIAGASGGKARQDSKTVYFNKCLSTEKLTIFMQFENSYLTLEVRKNQKIKAMRYRKCCNYGRLRNQICQF